MCELFGIGYFRDIIYIEMGTEIIFEEELLKTKIHGIKYYVLFIIIVKLSAYMYCTDVALKKLINV